MWLIGNTISEEPAVTMSRAMAILFYDTETAGSTKMVAPVYQTTWQHIPEHHIYYHEKHKSFTVHYNLLIL